MKLSTKIMFSSLFLGAASTQAVLIEVSFTSGANTAFAQSFGQFSSTASPVVTGGATSSPGLELLAELGDVSEIIKERGGQNLFGGPTLFGETNSVVIDVDPNDTFFNFASMVLPSNDWFIGTGGTVDVLDISALLGGTATSLEVVFNDIYDAGTELEDFDFVAPPGAFIPGFTNNPPGGTETPGGVITLVDLDNGNPFEDFANIPDGFDVSAFDPTGGGIGTLTLTVVPEPSSSLLAGLALAAGLLRRRRA